MGQQQILLIVLGIIMIAIAIAVGITLFGEASLESNRDGLVTDLNALAVHAFQFKLRLRSMGGGGGAYVGLVIPSRLASNDNGTYSIITTTLSSITLQGTSKLGFGTVTAVVDSVGKLSSFTYTGEF